MGDCDAVLKQGVFDTIIVNTNRSVSDNLLEWLKTVEFSTFKEKTSAGLNVGFPIKGIPIKIGADFDEDEFKEWQKAVQEENTRSFTENETLQMIKQTASKAIVDAWLDCIRATSTVGTGLNCSLLSDDTATTILFKAQFIPNSPADADMVPKVEQFIVTGASSVQGISVGDELPFSGAIATIVRNGNSEVTINLDTEKGVCTKTVPAIPEPPPVPSRWEVALPFCNPIETGAFPSGVENRSGTIYGSPWSTLNFSNGIKLHNVGAMKFGDDPLRIHLQCADDVNVAPPIRDMRYNVRIYQKDRPDEAATVTLLEIPGVANPLRSTEVRVQVALTMYGGTGISPMPDGLINLILYFKEANSDRWIHAGNRTGIIDSYLDMKIWSIETVIPPNSGIKAVLLSQYVRNLWGPNPPGHLRIHDARLSGVS